MNTAITRASTGSLLFVPGNRLDRFDKAVATGAAGVILDLEDAVAPQNKAAARNAISSWISTGNAARTEVIVHINGAGAHWHDEDISFVSELPASVAIMCPKSELTSLRDVARRIDSRRALYGLVETVAGVLGLREMAEVKGLHRFAFGNVDFGIDAGITVGDDELELAAVRTMFVLESRFAGLPPPVDGVSLELKDQSRISEHAARAKRFGFGGKLCIHPDQVHPVNAAFGPSTAEVEWARNVLEKFDASAGSAVAYGVR